MREALKRRWLALRNWRWKADRPYRLIAFALLPLVTVAILERLLAADELGWLRDWVKDSAIYGPLFFPEAATVEWKDRLQAILVLLGLPVAFCLWYWRDRNVRDQIEEQRKQVENQRKDINLKEFQEVQLRAAGALDEKLPTEAREQLQIAALHQLRGFLRGEYGESFRRPAFELLLAGHAAAMERIGLKQAIERWRRSDPPPAPTDMQEAIAKMIADARGRLTAVDRERAGIIRDEWEAVFLQNFPLSGRRLDGIEAPHGAALACQQLADSVLIGADLCWAQLEGANLSWAHLEGVNLRWARLEGADLSRAHLEGADLGRAQLNGTDLIGANLEGADLFGAHFEGAKLIAAHLEGADLGWDWKKANFRSATFDDTTMLLDNWEAASEDQRNEARDELRALGARHVDDPPAGEAQGATREDAADEAGAAEPV